MRTAFRIGKTRHAHDALSGQGALIVGARWHHKGAPIVYCATTLSLAALEVFVHFGMQEKAIAFSSIEISIPDGLVSILSAADLPTDWRDVPPPRSTADIGSQWLVNKRSAVLQVPSAVTLGEYNYLLNPAHPDFPKINASPPKPYTFDPRMWK